jgi:hypothetical protein
MEQFVFVDNPGEISEDSDAVGASWKALMCTSSAAPPNSSFVFLIKLL